MKATLFVVALLVLPLVAVAKTETTRIEIARGKRPFITLSGPDTAGQFTIWSGPGTSMTTADGTRSTPTTERDFADWAAGPVQLPHGLEVFKVRFYCAAAGANAAESVPSHQCYGVRYAYDRTAQRGYIQIPPAKDRDFPLNTQAIYRGVEGSWYHASARWDEIVRGEMEALRNVQSQNDYLYEQQPYIVPPSRSAVSATPKVTPKTR